MTKPRYTHTSSTVACPCFVFYSYTLYWRNKVTATFLQQKIWSFFGSLPLPLFLCVLSPPPLCHCHLRFLPCCLALLFLFYCCHLFPCHVSCLLLVIFMSLALMHLHSLFWVINPCLPSFSKLSKIQITIWPLLVTGEVTFRGYLLYL